MADRRRPVHADTLDNPNPRPDAPFAELVHLVQWCKDHPDEPLPEMLLIGTDEP